MLIDYKHFNLKRFLVIIGLFSALAALMLFIKPKNDLKSLPRPFPLYELYITASNAKGSIIINGIAIAHHQSGADLRTSKISLTPWLKNGMNSLHFTTSQPQKYIKPDVKVELETTPITGDPVKKLLFQLQQSSSQKSVLTVRGLPTWQWQNGEKTLHDVEEIKAAVKELHRAFKNKDIKAIRKTEAPLFQDMELLTGREGLERRVYRNEIIEKGQVEVLRAFTIVPFDNGRIMRVSGADGEAPIRVYFRYGNGGKVILTGQFWSKIKGQWRVVR